MRTRLGQYLVLTGIITDAQLQEAMAQQAHSRQPLGEILRERGWVSEAHLAQTLAAQLDLDFVDVAVTQPDPEALEALDPAEAERLGVLPLRWRGEQLCVAMADPLDIEVIEDLEARVRSDVVSVVAEAAALGSAIADCYAAHAARRERVELIRTELRLQSEALHAQGHGPRLVVCVSGSAGVGLTHLVTNVGAAAAAEGYRVIAVDASAPRSNGLAAAQWTDQPICQDLVHTDLAAGGPSWGETPHGTHLLGGATGAALRSARPEERLTLCSNLFHMARAHDVVVCDLGSPPLESALELLLGADVPVVVTTPQEIVAAYDLLRAAALDRRRRYPADADPEPWDVGIVVTLVDSGAVGRSVFDHLDRAVQRHLNATEFAQAGQLRLGLLGTIPCDVDSAAAAEAAQSPAVQSRPDSPLATGSRAVASAILERMRRLGTEAAPLASLLQVAGTTPDRLR